ncbi:MAG: DNA polymerase III subunit alpha [Phycisphaerales bacterium]|jgi:DNA polymerase-3 subunit alpha|nr:DNA polymerase III subunit alpha [Phycisphaerales bacterium]
MITVCAAIINVRKDANVTSKTQQNPFVHLHLHSEYSLLDGGNKIDDLLQRIKDMGMDSVAITDHGNLFGAFEFYTKATKAKIKPILGIEAYVAIGDRKDRKPTGIRDSGFHLVLLAENNVGWKNLVKLSSDSYLNGFYYKPRMDKETLEQWSDGLIAINGHLGSSIAYHLCNYVESNDESHWKLAIEEASWHAKTFSPNKNGEPRFYIELQRHDTNEQTAINPYLVKLAEELHLPIVCDNDAHFLEEGDWNVHDTLCCISMQKKKDDPDRLKYSKELYIKSPEKMIQLFNDLPEAIENSSKIASRCCVSLDTNKNHAPVVGVTGPDTYEPHKGGDLTEWFKEHCQRFTLHPYDSHVHTDISADDLKRDCDKALLCLCRAGLIWRYGVDGVTDEIKSRLDRELEIISGKSISAYFLIVWDFVDWARQHSIPANARGSGVGTMVGYVLGLSNACPVKYGLLFERFTDPDRSEYPDIDIDICQDGRGRVIDFVRKKYGHVAQIITFGRLKARAAIKDVARVHGLSVGEGQRLANLVPSELNISIDESIKKNDEFLAAYKNSTEVKRVIDTAKQLEYHVRHVGVHAAGVVIATEPLENIVPLCRATGSSDVVTQWDGPTCERVGLLKMDFLGLRTLSTIELCKKLITDSIEDKHIWGAVGKEYNNGSHPLDLERIDLEDQRVLDLFRRGDTAGVFQFESGGMRRLLKNMKPTRLEDLIAANALFRPGPMELIETFCARKNGREKVPVVHDIVDKFTRETYGIMVYQEQVMQIVHALGDISLRDAYSLIKAIGKKKYRVINSSRPRFVDGAVDKGLEQSFANDLFDLILKFAGYGFNKSHSTGYSITAFQTAYLKTYFPVQYMAALLTYESGARKTEDWAPYISDCRKTVFPDHSSEYQHVGFEVGPPDINQSDALFSVAYGDGEEQNNLSGGIRFGLGAVKGTGSAAVSAIVQERESGGKYKSIFDFCSRISAKTVNRSTVEQLIRGGAFDSLHGTDSRASLMVVLDKAISIGASMAKDRQSGQGGLFGGKEIVGSSNDSNAELPRVSPWSQQEKLNNEKEVLGIHVSGHPLDEFDEQIGAWCSHDVESLKNTNDGKRVVVGGTISAIRIHVVRRGTSSGKKMAVLTIQDRTGSVDCVLFSDQYQKFAHLLQQDSVAVVLGKVDRSRGELQMITDRVTTADDCSIYLSKRMELTFHQNDSSGGAMGEMELVSGLIKQAGAAKVSLGAKPAEVVVHVKTGEQVTTIRSQRRVVVEPKLFHQISRVIGKENIRLISIVE